MEPLNVLTWTFYDYPQCNWNAKKQCYFLSSTAVYKCLRTSTRHVILTDPERQMKTEDVLKVLDMIHYLAQQRAGVHLTTLHLVGLQLNFLITSSTDDFNPVACVLHNSDAGRQHTYCPIRGYCRLEDFIWIGRGLPCKTLHLVDCRIKWLCPFDTPDRRRRGPVLTMELPVVRLMINEDFGCSVWTACETALAVPSDAELHELGRWVTAVFGLRDDDLRPVAVCKTLCATHSSDPRPSAYYRGRKWCVDGLGDVQLAKLSRITMYFLKQLALPTGKGWKFA
ncbi:uncharacterized protein LOC129601651 [Paramacrobiotus metropolitanus]|uniref:uncharacterized protein LOC129601651 n=1 Tax=Paramacrobiotus metropolitanus TaxID=2943436 RepID=UPI0024464857|nr:uncharacterized protein LOC129601651 [Paramacrobiotus metropolitanus]